MDTIVITIVSVTVLGVICAVILAVASKIMAVKSDELVADLRAALPGANCGACGFTGCEEYAAALAEGDTAVNMCVLGGNDLVKTISEIIGSDSAGSVKKLIAVVNCVGDSGVRVKKMEYEGILTCVAEKMLFGGQNACTFGCRGFGDCVAVCPIGAICMDKGLARIDPRRCAGCGLCAKACPNGIISLYDADIKVAVKCSNVEKGGVLKDKCNVGCIGCMKCVKACTAKAISVNDNLASIDYSLCTGCGDCVASCAKGCIIAM